MEINEILKKLEQFIGGETEQSFVMSPPFPFENDYIKVLRIDTSNKAGGREVLRGKQWSIIIKIKKDFKILSNWRKLKKELGNDLDVTEVTRGEYCGCQGIRIYRMSRNMDRKIIEELLEFIFE
jgi:hypothetical protein